MNDHLDGISLVFTLLVAVVTTFSFLILKQELSRGVSGKFLNILLIPPALLIAISLAVGFAPFILPEKSGKATLWMNTAILGLSILLAVATVTIIAIGRTMRWSGVRIGTSFLLTSLTSMLVVTIPFAFIVLQAPITTSLSPVMVQAMEYSTTQSGPKIITVRSPDGTIVIGYLRGKR